MKKIEKLFLGLIGVLVVVIVVALMWESITVGLVLNGAFWLLSILLSSLLGSIVTRHTNSTNGS